MGSRPVPDAGGRSWRRRCDELSARPSLSAAELDELADAWFWLDDPDRSMAVRREAYRRHVEHGDDRCAAAAAWRLFADHHLVGENAPAAGWLERCRRHVEAGAGAVAVGWLAIAEADCAATAGDHDDALRHALAGEAQGRIAGDHDLTAMGLQAVGRAQIALGDRAAGIRRLDEAMVAVTNGELRDLFTGWVFCNVVSTCYAIGDLRRATEWSDAAMRWCATLRDGLMYPGLCRVYAVELAYLRGDWDVAAEHARRATEELTAYDPRYAGAAFSLVGDFHRVRGELDEAEAAYTRAHELGVAPQPGLALAQLARGNADDAMGALRSAWAQSPEAPLPRAQILAALVDAAVAVDDDEVLGAAVAELEAIGENTESSLLAAIAGVARGVLSLRLGDVSDAIAGLRSAAGDLDRLGFPYEAARGRVRLADALIASGDPVDGHLELQRAIGQFVGLRATLDLEDARARLRPGRTPPQEPCPLSSRELDVLRLVAAGRTNVEVANDLVISHHTVARHMSNVRTKLGVASRTAATALAYEHGWLRSGTE
ncbi:LuxR C-terminal-related transcriptional regulator [Ilumatobacter sp.]|uniref:LuxR C-terminal-related transcriptional regulator n=1 Tax=Ilumatobacter sp. TaxID=1967498 RepID=UPI003AF46B63